MAKYPYVSSGAGLGAPVVNEEYQGDNVAVWNSW
jgi:hypothetical protein